MAVSFLSYNPLQIFDDLFLYGCDEEDVSFDDHLFEISVPILYLGAGGGTVTTGNYTSSLTASADLTTYLVSIPGKDPASAYGHADLWFAYDADEIVQNVLRQWLVDHTGS
jgi:hypothetical protein